MLLEFFSPMSPTIPLKNIVAILHQLTPFPQNMSLHLFLIINTFTLNKILFVQALTIVHVF
jgi:hypothetical protein